MAGSLQTFTDSNFQAEVLDQPGLVLVDFYAPWCQPCKMLAPTLEALATEFQGQVRIGKLDTDANLQTAKQFGIMGLPTVIFFKGGNIVDRKMGVPSKSHFADSINRVLNPEAA